MQLPNPSFNGLKASLDPRGLKILKRKLRTGEITPYVFKEVLKRQMVKQYLREHRNPLTASFLALVQTTRSRFGLSNPVVEKSGPYQPGPFDMEELFALASIRRN